MYDAAGAHTAASHFVLDPHHNDTTHAASTTSAQPAAAPTHAPDGGTTAVSSTPIHAASTTSTSLSPSPTPIHAAFLPPTPNQGGNDQVNFSGVTNTFVGGNPPVVIDSGITISPAGDNQLKEVIIQVTNNGLSSDLLAFNNGPNAGGLAGSGANKEIFADGSVITASFLAGGSGTNGVQLTLTGNASTNDYATALDQVTFSSSVNDPTAGGTATSRDVGFQFVDTNNIASLVNTTHLDTKAGSAPPPPTPPSVTAGATATFTENGPIAFLDTGISVSGGSFGTLTNATITITNANPNDQLGLDGGFPSLTFTDSDKITVASAGFNSGTGQYVFALSGTATIADYKTALSEIDYAFAGGGDPTAGGTENTRNISWVVANGSTSSTAATSTLNVVHTRRDFIWSINDNNKTTNFFASGTRNA
ncbi:MAG: hypothetical protein JOY67_09845, partial [Hyphomicrobiales bacterium]|nr:hypothetical protein [Hyphomicrobiales bacterium]